MPTEAEWAFATRVQGRHLAICWGRPGHPEMGAPTSPCLFPLVTGRILGYTDNVVVSAEVESFRPTPEVYTIWVVMSRIG